RHCGVRRAHLREQGTSNCLLPLPVWSTHDGVDNKTVPHERGPRPPKGHTMTTTTTPAAGTAASPLALAPGRWTLDPNHSAVHFVIRHLGLSNVRGRFARFDAVLEVGESLGDVRVAADVDMSSVDTNNADRDAHLRSTDFFDTDRHPTLTFRSSSVSRVDG